MKLTEAKLTAEQQRYWTNAKTAFVWTAPGWAHILSTMLNPTNGENIVYWTTDIPQIGTDGRIAVANPDWFFKLKLKQRVAALGHVVSHAIYAHMTQKWRLMQVGMVQASPTRTVPFVPSIADFAQDLVINRTLAAAKIGELLPDWVNDDVPITDADGWVDVYVRVYDQVAGDLKRFMDMLKGMLPLDMHMDPGTTDDTPAEEAAQHREMSDMLWKNAMAQAAAISREMGSETGGAQQKFFEQFLEPKVTWQDELRAEFSRMPGAGSYDWDRADDELIVRGIYAPARSGHGCRTVVVIMDSSGSIYAVPKLIDRFFGELSGIMTDIRPKRLIVIWCDDEVRKTFDLTDDVELMECYHQGAHGGGGTSFVPPFEWLAENDVQDIDMAVYLTDGDGLFPSEPPPFPLVWGDISHYREKYPDWAHVVPIPNDGTA